MSPYDNLVIDSQYIQEEAREGRLTEMLYAVSIRDASGVRTFRLPTEADRTALAEAEQRVAAHKAEWIASGFLPSEDVPEGSKTSEPLRFGMLRWTDFFSDRQLVVHATFAKVFASLIDKIRDD